MTLGNQPRTTQVAGIAVAVVLGLAVALQSRINGELGQRIDDGVAAAVMSSSGALVLLAALLPGNPGCAGDSNGSAPPCGMARWPPTSCSAGSAARSCWPARA